MDITISVDLNNKFINVMAVPIYVPEGIGPVDTNNNSHQSQTGLTPESNPANSYQVNRVILRNHPQQPIDIFSFPHQLILELFSLYNNYIAAPLQQQQQQSTRSTTTTESLNMDPTQRVNNSHNQRGRSSMRGRSGEEDAVSSPSSTSSRIQYPLPDVVECHAGLSLDVTYEGCSVGFGRNFQNNHRRPSENQHQQQHNDGLHNDPPRLAPRSNNNERNDEDDDRLEEELAGPRADWTLQVKLLVGPWQQTGMELRTIADHFQLEYANSMEERAHQRRRRIRCKIVVNLGIPALALVGLGIAWFRRH